MLIRDRACVTDGNRGRTNGTDAQVSWGDGGRRVVWRDGRRRVEWGRECNRRGGRVANRTFLYGCGGGWRGVGGDGGGGGGGGGGGKSDTMGILIL